MSHLIDKLLDARFSRRQFLKGSAVATAAVAGLSLTACSKESSLSDTSQAAGTTAGTTAAPTTAGESVPETTAPVEHSPIVNPEEGGTWVSAACWHNCAGRCLNKVMVKDGMVIR